MQGHSVKPDVTKTSSTTEIQRRELSPGPPNCTTAGVSFTLSSMRMVFPIVVQGGGHG